MTDFLCTYFSWGCGSNAGPHAVPEISAMPLIMAVCVVFIAYAVITGRSLK